MFQAMEQAVVVCGKTVPLICQILGALLEILLLKAGTTCMFEYTPPTKTLFLLGVQTYTAPLTGLPPIPIPPG